MAPETFETSLGQGKNLIAEFELFGCFGSLLVLVVVLNSINQVSTVQNMSTEPSNSKDPKSVYDFTLKVAIYLFHFTSFFLSLSARFHLTTIPLFCSFIYLKHFFFLFSSIPILQDGMGNDVDLATYKGKVLLIVNVASKWYVYPTILSFIKRTCS